MTEKIVEMIKRQAISAVAESIAEMQREREAFGLGPTARCVAAAADDPMAGTRAIANLFTGEDD